MKELARRLLPALSEHQRRLAAACVLEYADATKVQASHLTPQRLESYLQAYFKDPLAVTRRQNDFMRGVPWPQRKTLFREAPLLNYLTEREAHIRPYAKPSSQTHQEVRNQEYLFHGDMLPGTRFLLDQPSTHDREYLKIKKNSESTLQYTPYARQLAAGQENHTQYRIAEILMDVLKEKGGQKNEPRAGGIFGAGTIIASGDDVCRHKAAMLVQNLQEAGIKAKYVRGDIRAGLAGGRHAWVHAELDGRQYRLDPQWGIFMPLSESAAVTVPSRKNPKYTPDPDRNVVWRRKRKA